MDSQRDNTPGFWRRLRVTPADGAVCSQLEDDFHCMSVTVHHRDGFAVSIEPQIHRAPWTTCPGAEATLTQTFRDLPLSKFAEQAGQKRQNCTHLFDLAVLAAAHAADSETQIYDILVSDPVAGERSAEIRRNGELVLHWKDKAFVLSWPEELAGQRLDKLRQWIDRQDEATQEAARLLQWGMMLAHGRTIPLADQSDASKMPSNCYTFQPERARRARRVGEIIDFSHGSARPLDNVEPALPPSVCRA